MNTKLGIDMRSAIKLFFRQIINAKNSSKSFESSQALIKDLLVKGNSLPVKNHNHP